MGTVSFEFEKADGTGRYVRGFAYLTKDAKGAQVQDFSGQWIDDIEVLRDGAHDFMEHRIAKGLHGKSVVLGDKPIGDIVESLIIDDAVAKALSITDKRRGWYIGMRINDTEIQKRVRSGELRSFSLGGGGKIDPEARMAA